MVTLGFIDPDRYLGGRVQLKPERARDALDRRLGERFGWSTEESAAAVHDLVVVNMANAVREVSVGKGHDPRDFLFLAYGGTLPLFASQIADRLGISTIVIPQNSSVFCALGVLASDFVVRNDQGVGLDLSKHDGIDRVNDIAARMVEDARREMAEEGFGDGEIEIQRSADLRFQGQEYELTLPLPDRELTPDDAETLAADFFTLYERTYGEGTAWVGVPATLVNYSVTVVGRQPGPTLAAASRNGHTPDSARRGAREAYLPDVGRREEIPVYDGALCDPGIRIEGPAIIDETDTTIYVPTGTTAERDEYLNYVLTR
jgi:N-methylhydantoinase A